MRYSFANFLKNKLQHHQLADKEADTKTVVMLPGDSYVPVILQIQTSRETAQAV